MATQKIYNILLLLQFAGVAVAMAIAWHWPLLGDKALGGIENRLRRIGEKRGLSIATVCLVLIIARLAVMPLTGIPVPQVHDAFSYLLASDTFAHGRLTNPPHPMDIYLQSFHEIQSPTYMSKYPPATGAVLAIGQKLGHPWIGVLLSVAVMCGVITWALQGWFPSNWALLGGILAVAGFAGTNEWTSGYTDGPIAAIGGALMIGAFPRILLHYRPRHAMLFALGIGILANSRPYEGTVFSAITVLILGLCLIKKRNLRWPKLLQRVVAPLACVLILVGAFMAYYNWRVTRNPFLLPYQAYTRSFEDAPIFLWGTLEAPKQYPNPQFAAFYAASRQAWLAQRQLTWNGLKLALLDKLIVLQRFYAPPEFAILILAALVSGARNRKVKFWFAICAVLAMAALPVAWIHARYVAAFTAAVYALTLFGLRSLRRWKPAGRPVGLGMARFLVLFHLLLLPAGAAALALLHAAGHVDSAWARKRQSIQSELESMPGQQLVLVRYPAAFDPGLDLVFNPADIDQAKVVWAREIPGLDIRPLLDYFRGRRLWLVEAGSNPQLYACETAEDSIGTLCALPTPLRIR